MFYYVAAWASLPPGAGPLLFCTPSGNFGNLTAGLMAKRMGIEVDRFVAATNINDVVPDYLATGVYQPRPSLRTLSNAMDVGAPSNLERIIHLYDGDLDKFERVFHASAHLYSTDGGELTDLPRADYFEMIRGRESPRSQGLARHDRIVSVHKAGRDTALAIVNCAMPPRYFTDYLTLMRTAAGWQIVSKAFHTDVHR